MRIDHLLTNVRVAHMNGEPQDFSSTEPSSVGIHEGRICWLGPLGSEPEAETVEDLGGRWLTPALIDCHTHLVFAGDRSDEYERRLAGESYAEIAASGGGIGRTVATTRDASAESLQADATDRLRILAAEGVGTVEIKSGYGLNHEAELRMLRAARAAGEQAGVRVIPTLLAAHSIPPEYSGRSGDYIREVCVPLIRSCAEEDLADAVDAFCEAIAFSPEETREVFEAAAVHGLPVKLHADQLTDSGGAALVAEFGGLSADHIEYTSDAGVRAMAQAGTVAVLLPGAFYTIGETQRPPISALRESGVPMAVATDANPGSSPLLSLLTAANLACTLFGLTVQEALAGVTRNAATALGLDDEVGRIALGMKADLAIWNVNHPAQLVQWLGARPLYRRMLQGVWS